MTLYRGVGGINQELKQQFRGVSGVNREIKEQYRGVGGVNRKVFSNSVKLYYDGDECAAKTGGYGVSSVHNNTFIKNSDNIFFSDNVTASSKSYSVLYTNKQIDLSSYSKICFDVIITSGTHPDTDIVLALSTALDSYWLPSAGHCPDGDGYCYRIKNSNNGVRQTIKLNLPLGASSSKIGYLTIATLWYSKIQIYKIWAE